MEIKSKKTLRLSGYDYAEPGVYFITICTHGKGCTLSKIKRNGPGKTAVVELSVLGELVKQVIQEISEKYNVKIPVYTIMPNHIHMLIMLDHKREITVGRFVGAMKSITANRWAIYCNERGEIGGKVWQRNFYDHIIRNEADYLEKWKYITDNPEKWAFDELYI